MTETKPGQDELGETAAGARGWRRRDKAPPGSAADPGGDPGGDPGAEGRPIGDPALDPEPVAAAAGTTDVGATDVVVDEVDAGSAVALLEAELAETKERLLRALAETENIRRRSAREVEEAHKYAVTGFARELLEVADNLTRALESIPTRAREEIDFVRTLAEGVALTERSLATCFERNRIEKVEPGLGDKFDHNRHQAMLQIETNQQAPGTIAQVMAPGYVIADRLLRPAMVGVAKAAPAAAPTDGGPDPGTASPGESQPGTRLDTTA